MAPHPQRLTVTRRAWPLARPLMTADGIKTAVDVVVAEISDVESRGRGEGVPLRRYGESIDSVVAALDAMKGAITSGLNRDTLQSALPPGAARNALELSTLRYQSGYSPYLEVLDAQRNLNVTELAAIRIRQSLLGADVDLMTALGGVIGLAVGFAVGKRRG